MPTIKVEDLVFSYHAQQPLFAGISFALTTPTDQPSGRIVSVVGASGCGKTTLLKLLAGIEAPRSGEILLDPVGMSVSYVPQDAVVFEHLSRVENARYFQNLKAHRKSFQEGLFQVLLERLKLRRIVGSNCPVSMLSGGERQRLALLRAASIRPGLMLMDEPCSGLDAAVKREFLTMLRDIVDEFQLMVAYATHHRDEVFMTANDVLYIDRRDAEQAAKVSLWSLDTFVSSPPTLEAAQFVSTSPLNVVLCNVVGSEIFTERSSKTIGRCELDGLKPGRYQVVFSPGAIRGHGSSGLKVDSYDLSGLYAFVRLSGEPGLIIVAPRDVVQHCFVRISGVAMLFNIDGTLVSSMEVIESGKGAT